MALRRKTKAERGGGWRLVRVGFLFGIPTYTLLLVLVCIRIIILAATTTMMAITVALGLL